MTICKTCSQMNYFGLEDKYWSSKAEKNSGAPHRFLRISIKEKSTYSSCWNFHCQSFWLQSQSFTLGNYQGLLLVLFHLILLLISFLISLESFANYYCSSLGNLNFHFDLTHLLTYPNFDFYVIFLAILFVTYWDCFLFLMEFVLFL